MSTVRDFFSLIRWPNLAMTIVAVMVHWELLIKKRLEVNHLVCSLTSVDVFCLGLALALVMSAGYVVNDVNDVHIDRINKPNKVLVGRIFSIAQARHIYFFLNFIAGILSILLAIKTKKLHLIWLLPVAIGLLYVYSTSFKKTFLVGNLIIVLLCAAVIWIPYLGETEIIHSLEPEAARSIQYNFVMCSVIAALLTLTREISKDIEDMIGDGWYGSTTLPIRIGEKKSRMLIVSLLCTVLVLLVSLARNSTRMYGLVLMMGILIFMLWTLLQSKKITYSTISSTLKLSMAYGMVALPFTLQV